MNIASIALVVSLMMIGGLASAGDDPNNDSGKNKGSTEAGISNSKHSSPVRIQSNTSGTIKSNDGKTHDYKTGKEVRK